MTVSVFNLAWATLVLTICQQLGGGGGGGGGGVGQCEAAKFGTSGPVLTVTLKDSDVEASQGKWLDLNSLRPNLHWSFQSKSRPLPNWLPSLQSLRGTVGYRYEELQRMPSFVEADLKFSGPKDVDLEVHPSYEFRTKRAVWMMQASRGAASLMTKLSSTGGRWLDMIRGCYQMDLPYATIGGVRVTPTWDAQKGEPSCLLEAITGTQRTKAVLKLERQNPTLTLVHAMDSRHVLAPEISLYDAKIIYQWNVALESGSIRTVVDPTSAVQVTWTDISQSGKWVTDIRLPLAGTTPASLMADVRVRKQISF